jgi:hypothetical protein
VILNQADANVFAKEWVSKYDNVISLNLHFHYRSRFFTAELETLEDAEDCCKRLMLDLTNDGNLGEILFKPIGSRFPLGDHSKRITDMLTLFSSDSDEEIHIKVPHPYQCPPFLRIIWSQNPYIELCIDEEDNYEPVVLSHLFTVEEAQRCIKQLSDEKDHLDVLRSEVICILESHVKTGKAIKKKITYEIFKQHVAPSIFKKYICDGFVYEARLMLSLSHLEDPNVYPTLFQTELDLFKEAEEIRGEIVSFVFSMDEHAYYAGAEETTHALNVFGEHSFIELNVRSPELFSYSFLMPSPITFACLSELRNYALDAVKKTLGPLRLKSLYSDFSERMITRLDTAFKARLVTHLDKEEIARAVKRYYEDNNCTPRMPSYSMVKIDSLYALGNENCYYVAKTREDLYEIAKERRM